MMHGIHLCSVPTSILAALQLLNTLIVENMYRMHSTSFSHRLLKQEVVTYPNKIWHEKNALEHGFTIIMYTAEIMHGIPLVAFIHQFYPSFIY